MFRSFKGAHWSSFFLKQKVLKMNEIMIITFLKITEGVKPGSRLQKVTINFKQVKLKGMLISVRVLEYSNETLYRQKNNFFEYLKNTFATS